MIFAKSSAVKLIRMSVAHESLLTPVFKKVSSSMVRRRSTFTVTENLKFNSFDSIKFTGNRASIDKLRPLIVVLEYMNAKGKHIQKVADVYLDRGFDVLQVSLKPMQLLFPVKGSQVVAKDLADFLAVNQSFTPLVIHAFSVGAYLWGETIMHFSKDLKTYQPVIDRIKALIYDSPADIEALTTAFPASLFPNNAILRASFSSYIRFHMSFWYDKTTKHYQASRKMFTSGLVKAPALFITSNADDLSSAASAIKAKDEILEKNLEASIRIFDGSKHVMHFKEYPKEYLEEVDNFLKKNGSANFVQLKAKL